MMKHLGIIVSVLLVTTTSYAAPSITSFNGRTISGADFGTHADNGAEQSYWSFRYEDFDDGNLTNILTGSTTDYTSLKSTNQRCPQSIYYCERDTTQNTAQAISVTSNASTTELYTSFWTRIRGFSSWTTNGFKLLRIYSDVDGPYPNFYGAISSITDGNIFGNVIERVHETPTTSQVTTAGVATILADNGWHRFEYYVKMSSGAGVADGVTTLWVDGVQIHTKTDLYTDDEGDTPVGGINTLQGRWQLLPYFDADNKQVTDLDEVVMDYTVARVELGNNSVFANCTHREYQPIEYWGTSHIKIRFNQGSFSAGSTAYLFVIDSDGTASSGYEITIDEEQSANISTNIVGQGMQLYFN